MSETTMLESYVKEINSINTKSSLKYFNDAKIVQFLLDNLDKYFYFANQTQLIHKIMYFCSDISIIKLVIDHPKVDLESKNYYGNTALHYMCGFDVFPRNTKHKKKIVIETIKYLIKKGANVNSSNRSGNTPLHVVCCSDNKFMNKVIKYLIKKGAHVNIKNNRDHAPIEIYFQKIDFLTMIMRSRKTIVFLLINGAKLEDYVLCISQRHLFNNYCTKQMFKKLCYSFILSNRNPF